MATQVDDTYWFGLSDIVAEDDWQWVDGTDFDPAVTYWYPTEPNDSNGNEDCAQIYPDGLWNDQGCTTTHGYICERRTVSSQACPDGWRSNQQSCYLLVDTPKTWQDARDTCHLLQADLASLTTADEQTYMATQVDDTYWFGLSDIVAEDDWQWVDGTDFDPAVTYWSPTEPNDSNGNEDCAQIFPNGLWNDQGCTRTHEYICERRTAMSLQDVLFSASTLQSVLLTPKLSSTPKSWSSHLLLGRPLGRLQVESGAVVISLITSWALGVEGAQLLFERPGESPRRSSAELRAVQATSMEDLCRAEGCTSNLHGGALKSCELHEQPPWRSSAEPLHGATTAAPAVTTATPAVTTTTPAVTTTTPASATTTPTGTTTTPAGTTTTPAVTATTPASATTTPTGTTTTPAGTTTSPATTTVITTRSSNDASIVTTTMSQPEDPTSPPPTASLTTSRLGEGGSAAANKGGAPGGAVAGGVTGAMVLVGAGIAIGGFLLYRKKKKVAVEPTASERAESS
ncbi:hypothetical protein Bbelb_341990 [Branchiostoma belcheri]|nr:hypothetical protein Bbelb_341990 [Branchiostoma belcheri]